MGNSVMQAAKNSDGKWVIGVDTDQSADSEKVITSALKMIATAVNQAIAAYYAGNFPGGQSFYMTVENNGVGLEINNAKFRSFTQADYDRIYDILVSNQDRVTSSIVKDINIKPSELPCVYVTVIE
jgi:basic membrane protein A